MDVKFRNNICVYISKNYFYIDRRPYASRSITILIASCFSSHQNLI